MRWWMTRCPCLSFCTAWTLTRIILIYPAAQASHHRVEVCVLTYALVVDRENFWTILYSMSGIEQVRVRRRRCVGGGGRKEGLGSKWDKVMDVDVHSMSGIEQVTGRLSVGEAGRGTCREAEMHTGMCVANFAIQVTW